MILLNQKCRYLKNRCVTAHAGCNFLNPSSCYGNFSHFLSLVIQEDNIITWYVSALILDVNNDWIVKSYKLALNWFLYLQVFLNLNTYFHCFCSFLFSFLILDWLLDLLLFLFCLHARLNLWKNKRVVLFLCF